MANEDYITVEEFERFKRFHAEQFKEYGLQLLGVKTLLENKEEIVPITPSSVQSLMRIVNKLSKEVQYLQAELARLKQ